jgi:hypothetical protein
LNFSFAIEGASSPFAEGLSHDKRMLGLGVCKLSIAEVAEGSTSAIEQAVEQEPSPPEPENAGLLSRLLTRVRG